MSTPPNDLPFVGKLRVAPLIVATSTALERYEAGDLSGALEVLKPYAPQPLPDRPEWLLRQIEKRHAASLRGGPIPEAALDWLADARDRLRRELGEEVLGAVCPVPLALRSALKCLGG